MIKKTCLCIGLIAVILVFTGCVGPSRVEMDYGTSQKLARFNQTLDPEAEKNLEPVTGLDGVPAKLNMERYRKSFEKESPRPTYILNVGVGQ